MAEVTGIAWTDSTFNPWIGCTKVGPGCDHCYAEALDKRHRWKGATHWGAGVERMRTSEANWSKPRAWNKARQKDGKPHRVFCSSLADVFDNEVPDAWRADLWDLIESTPALTWLLLTKRIGNAIRMLRTNDWAASPRWNVWLGATIVNQEEADRDVPKLLATPARVRFVSYEPALGPVNWLNAMCGYDKQGYRKPLLTNARINWIIVGGESAQGGESRPFNLEWATSTIKQAREIGAAPFVKQLGAAPIVEGSQFIVCLKDRRAGAEPSQWPEWLRVQEFPA